MNHCDHWLEGRRALVIGAGATVDAVVQVLRDRGATVERAAVLSGAEQAIADELAVLAAKGALDLLVIAGDREQALDPLDLTLEQWREGLSRDIDRRFFWSAAFARHCIAQGSAGNILLLLPSVQPRGDHAAEATIVGAMDNLVKTLAVEWARDGIRVNAIASQLCGAPAAGDADGLASLGQLAAYMLSDYGAYITGSVLGIDEI